LSVSHIIENTVETKTHSYYWMNQHFWMNLLSEWFNDSLILLDESAFLNEYWVNYSMTHSLLDESAFLNESIERMIQWLTHITGWISIFEWILSELFNDSLILLDESAFLYESIERMIQWFSIFEWIYWVNDSMTHSFYWMNQHFWMNLLSEWFKDTYILVALEVS